MVAGLLGPLPRAIERAKGMYPEGVTPENVARELHGGWVNVPVSGRGIRRPDGKIEVEIIRRDMNPSRVREELDKVLGGFHDQFGIPLAEALRKAGLPTSIVE